MAERTPAQLEATAKMLEAKAAKKGSSAKCKAAARKARKAASAAFWSAKEGTLGKARFGKKSAASKKTTRKKAAPKKKRTTRRKRAPAKKKRATPRKNLTPEDRVRDRLLALDVLEYKPGQLKEAPRAGGLSVRLVGNAYPVKEEIKEFGFQFAGVYWFMGYREIGGERQSRGSTSKVRTLDDAYDFLELAEEFVRQYNNRMLSRLKNPTAPAKKPPGEWVQTRRPKVGDTLRVVSWPPGSRKSKTSNRKAKRVTRTFVELHDGTKFRLKATQEHDAFTEIDHSSTWQASPDRITAVNGKSVD